MRSILLIVLSIVVTIPGYANVHRTSLTEANTSCVDCVNTQHKTVYQLQQLSHILVSGGNVQELSDANRELGLAPRCEFVQGNELGPWGEIIITEMRTNKSEYSNLYRGTQDLYDDCPRYPRLEDKDKELVWVMILNTMSHLESTCDENVEARGIKGRTAIGLLQLHKNAENRNGCTKGDGDEAETTLPCGLDMINSQLQREGELYGERGETYWAVLRGDQSKHNTIRKAIRKLEFCHQG
ncbi:hypothetical protein [Bdellovibrio reynosensis]|uniref:Transglycosylase SLT domain-containing protein n=1 Tax=Bdellovibrio reynosensis TaxID=2835041 RepID=A0ABY4CBZ4_9BACT|nr:hypothetical protein [Bdellovibrio reynosensis]UOF02498.1 hypothetical protein MNR06_05980 [Bdellovibrio reynosensis]